MDKKKLVQAIIAQLEKDIAALKAAALETYAAATGEESQPENEYDTRALEASYLAGAQGKRVAEVEESLMTYKLLEVRDFDDQKPIGPTALVDLDLDGKKSLAFITPASGGMVLKFEGQAIQVLTPKSPLGEALVGLKTGDFAIVDQANRTLEYEVLKVR
ncbi:MAG: GreA/GreB family elongation factor [Bdellovibrionaceae bacterium]|nr:GreA/GreB family elongation factor [Pseudobdellovibrionaceae bacterium]